MAIVIATYSYSSQIKKWLEKRIADQYPSFLMLQICMTPRDRQNIRFVDICQIWDNSMVAGIKTGCDGLVTSQPQLRSKFSI